jgi:Helicase HerA, central domain
VRGIRLSDRVLIAGQTGKGKTTLARYIVERMQPVRTIVFDPKGELSFPGVTPSRTPDQLVIAMREPIVHFIPASFDRASLEEACEIVWNTPGPYVWWIDEASEVSSPGYCPPGLRLGVTQGRQAEKMVIALTQRLAEIHPVFRSQSEHVIIFVPAPIELDLKTVAGNVRREARVLEEELGSLHSEHGDFSHLWFVRDTDELRRCAPLPVAGPGRPRPTATAAVEEGSQSPPCEESDSG